MDKIKHLLEQLGATKELTEQFMGTLKEYRENVRMEVTKEYEDRLAKAKKVCLEEVEKHKKTLAHRVQVYLESKAETIEQQISKQVAIKESAAESKLKAIATTLEGIEANSESNDADLRAAMQDVEKLKKALSESKDRIKVLESKAKRAVTIAESTVKKNRQLATQLKEAQDKASQAISEGATPKDKPADAQTRKPKDAPVVNENKTDKSKTPGKPATTRATKSSQVGNAGAAAASTGAGDFSPDNIASMMDV